MNQLSNKEIANLLETTADLLEIAGENPFKIKSYSIAAFRINKLLKPLHEMSESEIRKIENIGPSMVTKLEEILSTGSLKELENLLESTPAGILDLLKIKGLGAKKIRQLWLELEIESIGELAYACQENRLTSLKGFGQKTQENILKNIQFIQANEGKFLLFQVRSLAIELLEELMTEYPDNQIELVGDIARNNNIVTSLDFLGDWNNEAVQVYINKKWNCAFDVQQDCISVQLEGLPLIKFYCVENKNFGYHTLKHKSSNDFFQKLKEIVTIGETLPSEMDIFKHLELPFLPSPLRERENFTIWQTSQSIPNSIQIQDIKGLIHCHSTWSDGLNTIEQMAKACIAKGWNYMVLTDHSVSAFYANGLTRERIVQQHQEIEQLNQKLAPFKIFKGIEADILNTGDIDYDEETWKLFDVIIASVHSNLRMSYEKANDRLLKALDNPYVRILGHPTGRLLLSRDGYPIDHIKIIDKCAEKGIAIEINAHPRRLDLDWEYVNYALSKGVILSINPDAHSIEGIDLIEYGILSSQKTWMTNADNLSSFSLEKFENWIMNRK